MRAAEPTAPATTADIASVDDDKMVDRVEGIEEPEPAEDQPTEDARAETAEPTPTSEPDTTPLFDDAYRGAP